MAKSRDAIAAVPAADADAALKAKAKAERKAAKAEKKKRKAEARAAAEAAAAGAPNGAAAEPPAKKVKKLAAGDDSNTATTALARVGDARLAATRPVLARGTYAEAPAVAGLPEAAVAAWRAERRIDVQHCALRPILEFSQSGLSPDELHAARGFAAPSPIQAQCLPIALAGRDLVGIAATGSGKTLAFGLPALRHVRAQVAAGAASGRRPAALVLAPTRELAMQIAAVLEEAAAKLPDVRVACLYGGAPKRDQIASLRAGAAVVVATPGRLEDLAFETPDGASRAGACACVLDEVSFLVLDEADRMLDLGFEPAIRRVAAATRADRQTLMFSATWPPEVRRLAAEFMRPAPARVTVGSAALASSAAVAQTVEVIDAGARLGRLTELLQRHHGGAKGRANRVLVFALYKKEAAALEAALNRRGWRAAAVHGDMPQAARSAAVEAFRSGAAPLLVATDVAARGLDVPDVEVVINYSFPLTTEDYVHRVGRTGRAGRAGLAHTFFVPAADRARAGELVAVLREAGQPVPDALLAFGTAVKRKESKLYGAHYREVDGSEKAATRVTFSDSE